MPASFARGFDAFSLLAGAIVCVFAALSIWDVGTRSPLRLVRDAAAAARAPASLLRGLTRLAIGLALAGLAMLLTARAVPLHDRALIWVVTIGIVLAALALEALLGGTLRRLCGITTSAATEDRNRLG